MGVPQNGWFMVINGDWLMMINGDSYGINHEI